MPCSPLKVASIFMFEQEKKPRNQGEAGSKQSTACYLKMETTRSPKHRLTFNRLCELISQKIIFLQNRVTCQGISSEVFCLLYSSHSFICTDVSMVLSHIWSLCDLWSGVRTWWSNPLDFCTTCYSFLQILPTSAEGQENVDLYIHSHKSSWRSA
jgi:hypothetical protein